MNEIARTTVGIPGERSGMGPFRCTHRRCKKEALRTTVPPPLCTAGAFHHLGCTLYTYGVKVHISHSFLCTPGSFRCKGCTLIKMHLLLYSRSEFDSKRKNGECAPLHRRCIRCNPNGEAVEVHNFLSPKKGTGVYQVQRRCRPIALKSSGI